jgi:hypothetical protein
MVNEFGAVGGMRTEWGNSSTWRKPSPVLLCPSQIPHDLPQAAVVGSRRLNTTYVFTLKIEQLLPKLS